MSLVLAALLSFPGCSPGARDDDSGLNDDDSVADDDTAADDDTTEGDDDITPATDEDGDGWTLEEGDCDDGDPTIHPWAEEVPYDGIDQDCDGEDQLDADGDGHDAEHMGGDDCNDEDWYTHPGAPEEPYDGIDQDCDGADLIDVDGDGHLGEPAGGDDCDDEDANVYPGAEEDPCDGVDTNCDGIQDPPVVDDDGDGYTECEGDCDDTDPLIYADAAESCDGIDTNCDGRLIFGESDPDGDGFLFCSGDCDDLDASLTPEDLDGDSYSTCQGDCDDTDAAVNPSMAEVADGVDNDCDGGVDLGVVVCTITVPTDHPTIQEAIDAAQDGDVLCVLAGTYQENIDLLGKGIELIGLDGRSVTVLDGNSNGSVVTLSSGEEADTVLRGFTLTNGRASAGGGLHIEGSSPTIQALAIESNQATGDGGGLYVDGSSSTLTDIVLVSNDASQDGGGIRVVYSIDVALSELTINDNESSGGGGGLYFSDSTGSLSGASVHDNIGQETAGGVYVGNSSIIDISDAVVFANETPSGEGGGLEIRGGVTGTDVYVMGNYAEMDGGGILLWAMYASFTRLVVSNNTQVQIWDCGGPGLSCIYADDLQVIDALFSDNHRGYGGGLCLLESADVELTNVAFIGNSAVYGGAIRMAVSSMDITHGLFVDNVASNGGGAILLESYGAGIHNSIFVRNMAEDSSGAIGNINCGMSLDHSVVIQNSADDVGAIGGGSFGGSTITNTTITDNFVLPGSTGVIGGVTGTDVDFYNCNIYNNQPTDFWHGMTNPIGTDGNISVDPMFLDTSSPDPLDWDLHLDQASPLVDAGDPSTLDPDGSPSDIGAYGGPNADSWDLDWDGWPLWWQPGHYDHANYPDEGWDCDDLDPTVYPGAGC